MHITDGKYTAMIVQACFIDKPMRFVSDKAIEVIMVIASGDFKGVQFNKYYHISNVLTAYAVRDFAKIGIRLDTLEGINDILKNAVGKLVRVSAVTKDLGTELYLEGYIGTDDVSKYLGMTK